MSGELPSWMSGKSKKKKINSRSGRQERDYAKQHGGKVQAGSGCSPRAPEDVVGNVDPETGEADLVQLKFTDSKGYRITVDEWERIKRNARRVGREPKLVIDFDNSALRLVITEE